VRIDRPVFLVGVQGGGGTIVARTLYRHPRAVYASGNSRFWAGLDEIHNSRHTIRDLPESLIHRSAHFFNVDGRLDCHPIYGYQRCWLYAIDEFLDRYRRTAADADESTSLALRRVIGKTLLAYAHDLRTARFVDMSQLYTIQLSYIAELLRGCDPRFVLLTRNPYVTVARAARKEYDGHGTKVEMTTEQKMRCAIEHWHNSYRLALDDARGRPLLQVKYEDFLEDPLREVRRICEFTELEFDPRQVPGPGQRMPLGSLSPEKWYPLKPEENLRYSRDLAPELVAGLNQRAADVIRRLGYEVIE
ncbi:MAG TPA: sulfotransferase, partial [Candidatus Polarisedimenticolaceae bacterium]|nr:sulfotransferase [Candidatus Polarisedimenticolaceae bacterium]